MSKMGVSGYPRKRERAQAVSSVPYPAPQRKPALCHPGFGRSPERSYASLFSGSPLWRSNGRILRPYVPYCTIATHPQQCFSIQNLPRISCGYPVSPQGKLTLYQVCAEMSQASTIEREWNALIETNAELATQDRYIITSDQEQHVLDKKIPVLSYWQFATSG